MHDGMDLINDEIQLVSKHITDAAKRTLPCIKSRKRRLFKDSTLKQICDKSKEAWRAWVAHQMVLSMTQRIIGVERLRVE